MTPEQIIQAAKTLGCHPRAIYAVWKIEAGGHDGDTRFGPVILNERHLFYRFSGSYPVSRDYPELSSRTPGGYCTGRTFEARQKKEHERLKKKMEIYGGVLKEAALLSVSMGAFQVMGFNHRLVGYETVFQMWGEALKLDDSIDLAMFIAFVESCRLDDELRREDWAGFARGYNGPAYARNAYDIKLAQMADAWPTWATSQRETA